MTFPRLTGTHHHTADNIVDLVDDLSVFVRKDTLTVNGDLFVREGGDVTRLPVGTDGYVLVVSGGLPVWLPAGVALGMVIAEADGTPSVSDVTKIIFPNGSVSSPTAGVVVVDATPVWVEDDLSSLVDGSTTVFNTTHFVEVLSARVFLNGFILRPTTDYTENVDQSGITTTFTPNSGDTLIVEYQVESA